MNLSEYENSEFDRGVPRWQEALWLLVKMIFFLPPIPWPSEFRAAWLRWFGAKIGQGFVMRSGANITFPWRFEAGDQVWIGEDVLILSLAPVHLGANVCVSQRAFLCTGSHEHRKSTFDLITRPITIADKCWVAANAFVGPGVQIGPGSIVGAGTVLMKSIPANSFASGNPARVHPRS